MPAGALPNKIGLPQEQYGWAPFGFVSFGALAANLALAGLLRHQP